MLHEIASVKQDSPQRKRRWFRDENFDLYLWEAKSGAVTSLQLCYNRSHDEHILRWSAEDGYAHERVDAPEHKPGRAMTAILVMDGKFPVELVLAQFQQAALELPAKIRNLVVGHIKESASVKPPGGAPGGKAPRSSKPRRRKARE
jgi:hypothetical protein